MIPLSDQEIQQFRQDTKGTTCLTHFNNAGASLTPDVVLSTVINYLEEEATMGGYEAEAKYKQELDQTYELIAELINADQEEIAILESASAAWVIAFNGLSFHEGDEIITCEMEYVTNLIGFLNVQKRDGVVIKVIPNDDKGDFSLSAFEAAISPKTKLLAITHIASGTGGMMPIVEIGKVARKHNILYLLDACQSAGQVPLNVKEIGCDMLSVTGRKYLRAPRGTGFLFVKKEVRDRLALLAIDGFNAQWVTTSDFKLRDDGKRFELYEKSRALTLGLGKAIAYALHIGVDRIWDRIQYLSALLREQLKAIDGVTVHDTGTQKCGIVTFSVRDMDPLMIKTKLGEKKINVSVALAKSTLYFMDKNELNSLVRASVHYYNTPEELDLLCNAVAELYSIQSV
jgi:cysteine desulfurase/selenocysteine lyase